MLCCIPHRLARERKLIVRVEIHECEGVPVTVEVLHLAETDIGLFQFVTSLERLLYHGTGLQILHLGCGYPALAPLFAELGPCDEVRLPFEYDGTAGFQFCECVHRKSVQILEESTEHVKNFPEKAEVRNQYCLLASQMIPPSRAQRRLVISRRTRDGNCSGPSGRVTYRRRRMRPSSGCPASAFTSAKNWFTRERVMWYRKMRS